MRATQFIQTPVQTVMLYTYDKVWRSVWTDGRELPKDPDPRWFGYSVGKWKDDYTFVVDTIGTLDKKEFDFVDNWRTPHTKDMHVVERFKLIDGGNGLEATVTVEDPGTFNQPWSGTVRWQKVNRGTMLESICAENNQAFEQLFGLMEYPMPEAKTPDF